MPKHIDDGPARIVAIGTANPPTVINQQLAAKLIDFHYGSVLKPRSLEIMRSVLSHPSIRTRHIAVDSIEDVVRLKNEDPDDRMERFTKWSVALSVSAATQAMERAGVVPSQITGLMVNTCTGYICPGIATYLIEPLGLAHTVKLYDLVGSGCGGALPALQVAQNHCETTPDGVALSISVEICSATYQMGDDVSLLISNAIFGDGAAAAVVKQGTRGLAMAGTASSFSPANREDVRYVYKGGKLHNRLSPALPKVVGEQVPPFVAGLLGGHGASVSDVKHWAIHAGGEKILAAVQSGLNLGDEALAVSRSILERYGNMSSPTVLFELEKILAGGVGAGELCCCVGFGAGLSVYGLLLRG